MSPSISPELRKNATPEPSGANGRFHIANRADGRLGNAAQIAAGNVDVDHTASLVGR
jgi:hypothetical protein